MLKYAWMLITLLLVSCASTHEEVDESIQRRRWIRSIVKIHALHDHQVKISGTGVVISTTPIPGDLFVHTIVTAKHTIDDVMVTINGVTSSSSPLEFKVQRVSINKNGEVKHSDNLEVKVAAISDEYDIALITFISKYPVPAIKSRTSIKPYENIHIIGFPQNTSHPVITNGQYRGINDQGYIAMSCPVSAGMSGGPVLDDNGDLIGIVSSVNIAFDHISYAVGIDKIRTILD